MSNFKRTLFNRSSAASNTNYSTLSSLPDALTLQPTRTIKQPNVNSIGPGKRGLVIFPPVEFRNETFIYPGTLDQIALRKFVLFWDLLDLPENNILEISFNRSEIEFLQSCNVLQRTRVEMYGSFNVGQSIVEAHKMAFHSLNKASPGAWSTASQTDSYVFDDDELDANTGVKIKLYDALLIPDRDIPLAEILDFKEKRNDELLSLRHHLDDVYQKIIGSPDRLLAERSEIEKLDKSINDYNSAIREKPLRFTRTTLQANFSVNKAVTAALGAGVVGLPITGSTIAGIAAGLDVRLGKGLKGTSNTSTPFQYIHSLSREF